MTRRRSMLGRQTRRHVAIAVVAASVAAVAAMEAAQEEGREAKHNFFDLTSWSEDERGELRDHALAIRDLENGDWRRHTNGNEGESDVVTVVKGRRRLLSEEDFLRAAEEEWETDFRIANGGQNRDAVFDAGGKPGGIRRKAQKVTFPPKKSQRISFGNRNNFQPRNDFRCIDDSPSNKLPCPPQDLGSTCDKYNGGSFLKCYDYCKPSFCCIHDSLSTTYSPSCAKTEPNCPSYFACYIIWWKLHDTVGPANYLRIEQDEDFYDASFNDVLSDLETDSEFFQQLFGHHFDKDVAPTDSTFENPDNW